MGKCEVEELKYFVVGQSLRIPEWKEVVKLLDNFVHAEDELAYIVVTGIKYYPIEVPLLELKLLWREEAGHQNLHKVFVVCHGFVSVLPIFIFENFEGLS